MWLVFDFGHAHRFARERDTLLTFSVTVIRLWRDLSVGELASDMDSGVYGVAAVSKFLAL